MDEFTIMPNHLHVIIVINENGARKMERFGKAVAGSIPTIIRSFKSSVTQLYQWKYNTQDGLPFWQRGYYEHIIRNEDEFSRIRLYNQDNPHLWQEDDEYTA